MNKKTLLLRLMALCLLLTASSPAFYNNIPEDTTSQIMPLDDKTSLDNPDNND